MAAGGPDGKTRVTRSGTWMVRPASSFSSAARARRGAIAAAAAAAASPCTNARRCRRRRMTLSTRRMALIHRHHDVARLDHRVGIPALGELELVGGLVGDGGRHGLAADIELDMGGGGAFLHVGDLALEDVARAELHFKTPSRGRLAVNPYFARMACPSARMNMAKRQAAGGAVDSTVRP